jgi:hypothetical protein
MKRNEVTEVLFKLLTLNGTATRLDTCSALVNAFSKSEINNFRIISVITDGVPGTTDKIKTGFVTLFTQE